MSQYPYMPFFWNDFFEKTEHLSAEDAGLYALVLGKMWLKGGSLPDDDQVNAKIFRVSTRRWRRFKADVLTQFCTFNSEETEKFGQNFSQTRLVLELEKVKTKSKVNRKNGKLGGRPSSKNNDLGKPNGSNSLNRNKTQTKSETKPISKPEPKSYSESIGASGDSEKNTTLELNLDSSVRPGTKPDRKSVDEKFAQFKAVYPRRGPRKDVGFAEAEKKFERLVREGVDPDDLISAARNYGQTFENATDDERQFVKMASTFLGDRKSTWKDFVPGVASSPSELSPLDAFKRRTDKWSWTDCQHLVGEWERGRNWHPTFGPAPDRPDCQIRRDWLQELGWGPNGEKTKLGIDQVRKNVQSGGG